MLPVEAVNKELRLTDCGVALIHFGDESRNGRDQGEKPVPLSSLSSVALQLNRRANFQEGPIAVSDAGIRQDSPVTTKGRNVCLNIVSRHLRLSWFDETCLVVVLEHGKWRIEKVAWHSLHILVPARVFYKIYVILLDPL